MPPRPKKPSEKVSNKLLEAIRFLSAVSKDDGAPFETHVLLQNKTATAFNGTLAAGQLIEEDLVCAPHTKTFLTALSKCNEAFSLTIDGAKLAIKSGKFKANIPCIDPTLLSNPTPDPICCAIDNRFKEAISVIEIIKKENEQRVITLSFLLNGGSVIATDGKILIEVWHGLELPVGMPIPKVLIPVITGTDKKLVSFGYGPSSVTFYFEDNSFIRSQLYSEAWPDISHLINKPFNALPVPPDFFKALNTIKEFSDGQVYFSDGLLKTHRDDGKGASYEVEGLIAGPAYTVKYLSIIDGIADKIDFYVDGQHNSKMLYFTGKNCRGIISGYG